MYTSLRHGYTCDILWLGRRHIFSEHPTGASRPTGTSDLIIGLATRVHPHRQYCPGFILLRDNVQRSLVGLRSSDDIPLSPVDRHIPDIRQVEGPRGVGVELQDGVVQQHLSSAHFDGAFPH